MRCRGAYVFERCVCDVSSTKDLGGMKDYIHAIGPVYQVAIDSAATVSFSVSGNDSIKIRNTFLSERGESSGKD